MEFNHHHHHHHHHNRRHDEDEGLNIPPPGLTHPVPAPGYSHPVPAPGYSHPVPAPELTHPYPYPHHQPPPYAAVPDYIHPVPSPYPPPPYVPVYPNPAYVDHVIHASVPDELLNKPTFRIFSKAGPDYSLTIRDGEIVLALTNPRDVNQHWYKDEKFSTRVKDSDGSPAFSLINKGTGEAIKHSSGSTQPIRLTPYEPSILDVDVLWSQSRDQGDGYTAIRQINDIHLNMDAFHGNGGVHEGTVVVLWEWKAGDNQKWKIHPF